MFSEHEKREGAARISRLARISKQGLREAWQEAEHANQFDARGRTIAWQGYGVLVQMRNRSYSGHNGLSGAAVGPNR